MCKKLCIAVGAVLVGLLVIGVSPRLKNMATDTVGKIRSWNEDVSPEQQLKHLRAEMKEIDKDMDKQARRLAEMTTDVDNAKKDVVALADRQKALKTDIAAMTKLLDNTSEKVSFNGTTYLQSDLVKKLDRSVSTYDRQKAELKAKQEVLDRKTQTLNISTQRVKAMQQQKDELKVAVAELEARLESLKSQQVSQAVEVNDSQVNKCNVLLEKARNTIATMEHEQDIRNELGLNKTPTSDILRESTKSKVDVLEAAKKAIQDDEAETTASK